MFNKFPRKSRQKKDDLTSSSRKSKEPIEIGDEENVDITKLESNIDDIIINWKYSENLLHEFIKYQTEKQRTEQEKLKLLEANKIKEILQLATQYEIPKEDIWKLFNITQPVNENDLIPIQRPTTLPTSHRRSNTISTSTLSSFKNLPPPGNSEQRPYTHTRSGSKNLQSSSSSSSSSTNPNIINTNVPTVSTFKVNINHPTDYQFHLWDPNKPTARRNKSTASPNTSISLQDQSFMTNTSTSGNSTILPISPKPSSPLKHSVSHRRGNSLLGSPSKITKSPRVSHSRQSSMDNSVKNFVFPEQPPPQKTHKKVPSKADVDFMISKDSENDN